ncbi:MAG TPA: hypothetical protein VHO48_16010 [Anaerolineaceae bacterium]|nr:hypothetical protein [Anaerolineaceae bacterium]
MLNLAPIEPVDYLVIGHLTQDLTPNGPALGGTAAYSSLTAKALGLRVGIVTSFDIDTLHKPPELDGISISAVPAEYSSTFENIQTPQGRIQYIHHRAAPLNASHIPETWRSTPIVHLGPIANELDPGIIRAFSGSFIGITVQGFFCVSGTARAAFAWVNGLRPIMCLKKPTRRCSRSKTSRATNAASKNWPRPSGSW